jgi:hypothetical protein
MDNEIIDQPSWWKRNWKWALPTGGCLTIIIVFVAFIGYAAYKVSDAFSNDTSIFAFAKVVKTVQENPTVIERLGKPIELETENYDPLSDPGNMNFEMVLDGRKSDGVLKVIAHKVDDEWIYDLFTVTFDDTQEVLDLSDTITDEF